VWYSGGECSVVLLMMKFAAWEDILVQYDVETFTSPLSLCNGMSVNYQILA